MVDRLSRPRLGGALHARRARARRLRRRRPAGLRRWRTNLLDVAVPEGPRAAASPDSEPRALPSRGRGRLPCARGLPPAGPGRALSPTFSCATGRSTGSPGRAEARRSPRRRATTQAMRLPPALWSAYYATRPCRLAFRTVRPPWPATSRKIGPCNAAIIRSHLRVRSGNCGKRRCPFAPERRARNRRRNARPPNEETDAITITVRAPAPPSL
jgi:hypothetical protein